MANVKDNSPSELNDATLNSLVKEIEKLKIEVESTKRLLLEKETK